MPDYVFLANNTFASTPVLLTWNLSASGSVAHPTSFFNVLSTHLDPNGFSFGLSGSGAATYLTITMPDPIATYGHISFSATLRYDPSGAAPSISGLSSAYLLLYDYDWEDDVISVTGDTEAAFGSVGRSNALVGRTVSSWEFDWGDGAAANAQSGTHEYFENGSFGVTMTPTDQHGLQSTYVVSFPIDRPKRLGLEFGPAGEMITARESWLDYPQTARIDFNRYKTSPVAAFTTLSSAMIAVGKNPCVWQNGNTFYFGGLVKDSEEYHIWQSDDFGRTWEQITMATVWDNTNYHRAHVCGLKGGGAASIANARGSDPIQVFFKTTKDEAAWPADGDAVLVGTFAPGGVSQDRQFSIRQMHEAGRIDLVVTNGIAANWISKDLGRTWTTY